MSTTAPPVSALTVAQLTAKIQSLVEGPLRAVTVQGEISNYTKAGSGHAYFTLKDESAQIRAVLWRSALQGLRFKIHDGLKVVARGGVTVYPARGSYQLVVEQLLPHGIGPLELAFRQLRDRLEREGLFRAERKRPLPAIPRRIAIITSPTGAAIRDMLQILTRRWPGVDVVLLPVAVQGEGAASQIAEAFRLVPLLPRVDVVITGRGGGSLEDLWAFNEECVARAIAACPVPVISAVGHEVDVTIADFVADRRALTPSEAAELVVPDQADVRTALVEVERRLKQSLRSRAAMCRAELDRLARQRVFSQPGERVQSLRERVGEWRERLVRAMRNRYEQSRQHVAQMAGQLSALSPLEVLERGYSVTRHVSTKGVIRSAAALSPGDVVETLLHHGRITSRVETCHVENPLGASADVSKAGVDAAAISAGPT